MAVQNKLREPEPYIPKEMQCIVFLGVNLRMWEDVGLKYLRYGIRCDQAAAVRQEDPGGKRRQLLFPNTHGTAPIRADGPLERVIHPTTRRLGVFHLVSFKTALFGSGTMPPCYIRDAVMPVLASLRNSSAPSIGICKKRRTRQTPVRLRRNLSVSGGFYRRRPGGSAGAGINGTTAGGAPLEVNFEGAGCGKPTPRFSSKCSFAQRGQ